MKKIVSLLSVLTISATAVPTTIAASPYYQKLENKLENSSEVNFSQTSNLEKYKYKIDNTDETEITLKNLDRDEKRDKRQLSWFNKWWTDSVWDPAKKVVTNPSCIGQSYLESIKQASIGSAVGGVSGAAVGSIAPGAGTLIGGVTGAIGAGVVAGANGWKDGINKYC